MVSLAGPAEITGSCSTVIITESVFVQPVAGLVTVKKYSRVVVKSAVKRVGSATLLVNPAGTEVQLYSNAGFPLPPIEIVSFSQTVVSLITSTVGNGLTVISTSFELVAPLSYVTVSV